MISLIKILSQFVDLAKRYSLWLMQVSHYLIYGRCARSEVIATNDLEQAARSEARKPMLPDNGPGPAIRSFALFSYAGLGRHIGRRRNHETVAYLGRRFALDRLRFTRSIYRPNLLPEPP